LDIQLFCGYFSVTVGNMTTKFVPTDEWESALGAQIRAARLAADIDQQSLARDANVGVSALQSLEAGKGSTLRTLIRVVRALGLEEWLDTLYETSPTSPLALARAQAAERPPQRASRRRSPLKPQSPR
jgi:transcriptional regulator with XRE-family HTH domain